MSKVLARFGLLLGLGLSGKRRVAAGPPAEGGNFILQEDGVSFIFMEDGSSKIETEA